MLTIGHSTCSIEEFISILQKYNVQEIVDVRTVPQSRHNPQFNKEVLPSKLQAACINYLHSPGLGGLRRPTKDSPNEGWIKATFRGFADYMQTPEFEESLTALLVEAKKQLIAVMCAEAVPWRCHRLLIADALSVRGIKVKHIINTDKTLEHTLTPWIRVKGSHITYPPINQSKHLTTQET